MIWHLVLGLSASRTVKNPFLLPKLPRLWYFVVVRADQDCGPCGSTCPFTNLRCLSKFPSQPRRRAVWASNLQPGLPGSSLPLWE